VLAAVVTGANVPNHQLVEHTLDSTSTHYPKSLKRQEQFLICDKAYASYRLSDRLKAKYGRVTMITMVKTGNRPPNKTYTTHAADAMLRKRHIIENCIGSLKRSECIRE